MIRCRGLHKSYRGTPALRGVDLDVARGETFALLGPNGAGKSTAVEILAGFLDRDAGTVEVLGRDPAGAGGAWRAGIGVVPQQSRGLAELTVAECVGHFAGLYPAPAAVGELLETVGLAQVRRRRLGRLSGGQRRRVDLALGLVGRPELLFLDEPTTGLDARARRDALEVIRRLTGRGTTIVLTTHYLKEAEDLADRAAVLVDGAVSAVGPVAEIGGRHRARTLVEFDGDGLLPAASALPPDSSVDTAPDGRLRIRTGAPSTVLRLLLARAREVGVAEVPRLSVTRPSLEEGYLALLEGEEAEADEAADRGDPAPAGARAGTAPEPAGGPDPAGFEHQRSGGGR